MDDQDKVDREIAETDRELAAEGQVVEALGYGCDECDDRGIVPLTDGWWAICVCARPARDRLFDPPN